MIIYLFIDIRYMNIRDQILLYFYLKLQRLKEESKYL